MIDYEKYHFRLEENGASLLYTPQVGSIDEIGASALSTGTAVSSISQQAIDWVKGAFPGITFSIDRMSFEPSDEAAIAEIRHCLKTEENPHRVFCAREDDIGDL
ncbi:MAG: hypothetical protein HOG89_03835 [Candidatus Peribacter sp.]|jgi:hypothetical protein|nr:hypothetical protein [Candidatus Peribacter sp.]MBT4393098.1 hypothetical protein [Candidatus Peribacter sp.]MBT4600897.1 hypothetical protein [Candidatus Peribacter sp.]MBT5148973.1 hypothetical protein [Candidatus Peribacter sp.]MBT5638348.1 hypothetical protein [Candidatus Peribacter sp.]